MVEAPSEPELFIFTVINRDYMELGLGWGQQVRNLTGRNPHFICADVEALTLLSSKGFPCTLDLPKGKFSDTEIFEYQSSSFPNDKAAYTVSLKLVVAAETLRSGRPILYCDVDAIWLKDPIEEILESDVDFAFQPGSFPDNIKSAWGFTVCTGFFFMRPSSYTIEISDLVRDHFDGSDQRTLNNVLMSHFDLVWSHRPENWENCNLESGWVDPIKGVCRKTNLIALALPHVFYQRHGTSQETCEHAIICHPNSPKDQNGKIRILNELGIDMASLISSNNKTMEHKISSSKLINWIKGYWSSSKS